jgi:hypothetical protein
VDAGSHVGTVAVRDIDSRTPSPVGCVARARGDDALRYCCALPCNNMGHVATTAYNCGTDQNDNNLTDDLPATSDSRFLDVAAIRTTLHYSCVVYQ